MTERYLAKTDSLTNQLMKQPLLFNRALRFVSDLYSDVHLPRKVKEAIAAFGVIVLLSACQGTTPSSSSASYDNTFSPIPTEAATPTPTLTPTLRPIPASEPTFAIPVLSEPSPSLEHSYPGEFVRRGDPTKKVLYITVDDCWHAETIRQIVETLDEEGVNASFFPIGRAIDPENHPDQAQYIKDTYSMLVEYGNVLGNHTYNHNQIQSNTTPDAIKAELEHQLAIVREITGNPDYVQTWMRPPGGQGGLGEKFPRLGTATGEEKMGVLTWTLSSGGDGGSTTAEIIAHVTASFQNGAVILFHGYPNDANSLKAIIEAAKAQGYTFDTIDHLVPDPETSCTFDSASFPSVKSCG